MNDASVVLSLSVDSSVDFLFEPRSLNATTVDIFDVGSFGTYNACGILEQIMRSEIIIKKLGQDTTSRTCLAKMAPKR